MAKENSQSVSSTNGFADTIDVNSLTDDALFEKLKQLGYTPGPVTSNTRGVYEKKLLRLLNGEQKDSQGSNISLNTNSEVEIGWSGVTRRSMERNATPQPSTSHKTREPSREPSVNKQHPAPQVVPHRISFIEKVDKNSSKRFIEPIGELPYGLSPELRQRNFIGSWNPNVGAVDKQQVGSPQVSSSKLIYVIGGAVLLVILLAAVYLLQTSTDPYRLIEEDVKEELKSRQT